MTKPAELTKADVKKHMTELLPKIIEEVLSDSDDSLGVAAKVKLIEAKLYQSEQRFIEMFGNKDKEKT